MKILEMTATFGTLQKAVLRPGPGFTLILASNESGKSTWCAFLRAMLYGFPARDRDKAGYLAEKNRYQPWSGAAMEGTLVLEWQGRDLTLYRGPKGSTAWGTFSAFWTATGEAVEGLTAENCGEILLGVSREVFERTTFVGQGQISLSPSADLEKRVAALATSGEEDVSYSLVERRLKDWLNRRRVNSRVGLIPELEGELSTVEDSLERQGDLLRRAQEAQLETERLEVQKARLGSQLRSLAAAAQAQQAEKRKEAQEDYQGALAQLEAIERTAQALPPTEALRRAQGDLAYLNTLTANLKMTLKAIPEAERQAEEAQKAVRSDPLFGNLDAAQAAARGQRDQDLALELERKTRKGRSPLLLLFLPLLASICLTAWAWLRPQDPATSFPWWSALVLSLPILWGAALLVILPLLFFHLRQKKKLSALLTHYDAQTPGDIPARSSAYQEKCSAAQESRRELQALEMERDKLAAQKEELTAQLLNFVHPFAPEVTDLFGVSAALSRALQQGERYGLAKARAQHAQKLLSALPSPAAGESENLPFPVLQGDPEGLSAQLGAVNEDLRRAGDTAARLQGELRSLGDPAELEARRSRLLEQLDLRRGEYEAITAAMESLKNADSLLRERFSPAVNQKAGEYLAALTGGKYDRASLTRQFQALAQESGEPASRQDLSLSGGAAQQLYLAARLAMCELALPQAEPCPILLDDTLDAFDDDRAGLALQCLLEMAKKRQILLFSCHRREKDLLRGKPAVILEG